jgi:hypothetical protein
MADFDGRRQSNRDSSAAATGTWEADKDDMEMPEATEMTEDGQQPEQNRARVTFAA